MRTALLLSAGLLAIGVTLSVTGALEAQRNTPAVRPGSFDEVIGQTRDELFTRGQQIFRYDTFGDERFWSDRLRLHQAIAGARLGGVGAGVSPATALAMGLKVDADMVPAHVLAGIRSGTVDLNDPANTQALIAARAVVGLMPVGGGNGQPLAIGLTCAVCHSDVDDSVAPGIGSRLDGWPNRDLNIGAIAALAPDLSACRNCCRSIKTPCVPRCAPGDLASSTRCCSWMEGRSGPTARPQPRSSRRHMDSLGSTCTPTRDGAAFPTGMRSSPISNCMAPASSSIHVSTIETSFPSPRVRAWETCVPAQPATTA